jgi:hypothetical protein
MKIYGIETRDIQSKSYEYREYRFSSFFNNAKGIWHSEQNDAIYEGEKHQKIITEIYEINFESYKESL